MIKRVLLGLTLVVTFLSSAIVLPYKAFSEELTPVEQALKYKELMGFVKEEGLNLRCDPILTCPVEFVDRLKTNSKLLSAVRTVSELGVKVRLSNRFEVDDDVIKIDAWGANDEKIIDYLRVKK